MGATVMRYGFIGLGHMGGGMAPNLVKAGHEVRAFDLSADALAKAVEQGIITPALGQPQPLLPNDSQGSGEVFAFAHTLLHEHLTSIPGHAQIWYIHRATTRAGGATTIRSSSA